MGLVVGKREEAVGLGSDQPRLSPTSLQSILAPAQPRRPLFKAPPLASAPKLPVHPPHARNAAQSGGPSSGPRSLISRITGDVPFSHVLGTAGGEETGPRDGVRRQAGTK